MNIAFTNTWFRVEHCDDCFIAGHLIIRPQQNTNAITDLPEEALANLGKTMALCHDIINRIIKPTRIYTLSFCEVLPALHFHLFPRSENLRLAYDKARKLENQPVNGALFFDWARKYCNTAQEDYVMLQKAINAAFLSAQNS